MDYERLIAPAAKAMRPSGIRKFFDLAAEMPECISLGVGEPDFKTPWAVREAGIESLEHGRTRYTSNAGLKELRAEITRYLARRMNLHYEPSQVLVTVGGSEAIDMCIRTLVQPGDEVIIPEPCFVCYEPITTLSGGVPVHVACRQEDAFRLKADALKAAITPKTKLVIMPFPNNPTGAVMEREDLEAVAEVLRGTNIMVLSDEIYAELQLWPAAPRLHCVPAGYGGADHRGQRLLQELCHDGLAAGLCLRPGAHHQNHDQDPPERHHERTHHQPVRGHHRPERVRWRDRPDADEYNMRRRLVVKSFNQMGLTCFEPRGVLCVPLHQVHRDEQPGILHKAAGTEACGHHPRRRLWCLRRGLCPGVLRVFRRAPERGPEADQGVPAGKRHLSRGSITEETTMATLKSVTVLAPAKLNLALDVVGLLPNGYHNLDMTMQAITLYERVVLRRSNTPEPEPARQSGGRQRQQYRHQGGHCLFPVHGPFGGCGHHHS